MILERAAVDPFFKNGFVLGCEETHEAVIIDPGDEVEALLRKLGDLGLSATHILLTHAHLDHISGVGRAKAATGAPIWLHQADHFLYERVVQQGIAFGFKVAPQPPVDRFYDGEGPIRFGKYAARVRHTPGHCPGGVCLAVSGEDGRDTILFVGDTLFAGSIGRVDLPGGNMTTLLHSIRGVLFSFPDETPVWPGHGEMTTIGKERRTNPFLV